MRKRLHLYAMKQVFGSVSKHSGVLFLFACFALLLVPKIFQEGLFMDGCIYGSVARNLSQGSGSFWQLSFSQTLLHPFHEHPPLAFALQSLVFKVFGDQFFIERFYQLLIAFASAVLIIGIFKQYSKHAQLSWLAALLWLTTERVFWCANENMLESTMSVFDLLAVYFLGKCLLGNLNRTFINLSIAALAIFCAFLSKGLPALFPLSFFFFAFVSKQLSFLHMLKQSIYLLTAISLIFTLAFVFWEDAFESIKLYLQQQVMGSVQGKDRVGLRLPFISGFFKQIIPYLILAAIALLSQARKKSNTSAPITSLLFVLIGLSAFLPLLVSPKLSFYYLVPCFPYFSIATVLYVEPIFCNSITPSIQKFLRSSAIGISVLMIVVVCFLSLALYGTASRDAEMITEVKALKNYCPPLSVISVSQNLQEDWTLFAYLQRIAKLSVQKGDAQCLYLLAEQDEQIPADYSLLHREVGKRFVLYSKTNLHKKRAN